MVSGSRQSSNDGPERLDQTAQAVTGLTAEGLGVVMTGSQFNVDLEAARKALKQGKDPAPPMTLTDAKEKASPAKEIPAPSVHADPLHDFSPRKHEFLDWTEQEAKRLNITDDGVLNQKNAFRHAMTAAIMTLKYNGTVTHELGWANEQKDFNLYSSLSGKINLDKIADTNADLLNNLSGIEIAKQLEAKKGAGNVTLKDVEDEVLAQLKAGKLVDRPMQELTSGRLAPEILSYHHMAGLIQWEAENGPTQQDRDAARAIVESRHLNK